MTTKQHVRDHVYWQYLRECKMRNLKPIHLTDGEFAVYYEYVLHDMFKRLNLYDQASQDISLTPVTVFTEYALDDNYGGFKGAEILYNTDTYSSRPLEIVPMDRMPTQGSLISGQPNRMAIYLKNDGLYYIYLYPLASVAGTLRIRFKFAPTIESGAGSGADLTKACIVPVTFQGLMLDGIMNKLLPNTEWLNTYERGINQALEDRPVPNKGSLDYNLGGLEDDEIDLGYSKNWLGIE